MVWCAGFLKQHGVCRTSQVTKLPLSFFLSFLSPLGLCSRGRCVCVRCSSEEVCMSVVCKQLRCLMFGSEQIGIPLQSRGLDPKPGEVGQRALANFRGPWIRPHAPTFVVPHLKWCFLSCLSFLLFCFVFLFPLYGVVYNLNILCTYPTQWVEQTNIRKQIDVVNTVK